MEISSFDELLTAARSQPQPQCLLFVFAAAELSDDATPQERARFEAGEGGALEPVMAVDKAPAELTDFAALAEESRRFGRPWALVFVAALSGRSGTPPAEKEVEDALERMVEAVRIGRLGSFIPFDREGNAVRFG